MEKKGETKCKTGPEKGPFRATRVGSFLVWPRTLLGASNLNFHHTHSKQTEPSKWPPVCQTAATLPAGKLIQILAHLLSSAPKHFLCHLFAFSTRFGPSTQLERPLSSLLFSFSPPLWAHFLAANSAQLAATKCPPRELSAGGGASERPARPSEPNKGGIKCFHNFQQTCISKQEGPFFSNSLPPSYHGRSLASDQKKEPKVEGAQIGAPKSNYIVSAAV